MNYAPTMHIPEELPLRTRLKFPKHIHVRFSDGARKQLMEIKNRTGVDMGDFLREGLKSFLEEPYDSRWFYQEPVYRDKARVPYQHILRLKHDDWNKLQEYSDRYTDGNVSDTIRAMTRWYMDQHRDFLKKID